MRGLGSLLFLGSVICAASLFSPQFDEYDVDGDGEITSAEWIAVHEGDIKEQDKFIGTWNSDEDDSEPSIDEEDEDAWEELQSLVKGGTHKERPSVAGSKSSRYDEQFNLWVGASSWLKEDDASKADGTVHGALQGAMKRVKSTFDTASAELPGHEDVISMEDIGTPKLAALATRLKASKDLRVRITLYGHGITKDSDEPNARDPEYAGDQGDHYYPQWTPKPVKYKAGINAMGTTPSNSNAPPDEPSPSLVYYSGEEVAEALVKMGVHSDMNAVITSLGCKTAISFCPHLAARLRSLLNQGECGKCGANVVLKCRKTSVSKLPLDGIFSSKSPTERAEWKKYVAANPRALSVTALKLDNRAPTGSCTNCRVISSNAWKRVTTPVTGVDDSLMNSIKTLVDGWGVINGVDETKAEALYDALTVCWGMKSDGSVGSCGCAYSAVDWLKSDHHYMVSSPSECTAATQWECKATSKGKTTTLMTTQVEYTGKPAEDTWRCAHVVVPTDCAAQFQKYFPGDFHQSACEFDGAITHPAAPMALSTFLPAPAGITVSVTEGTKLRCTKPTPCTPGSKEYFGPCTCRATVAMAKQKECGQYFFKVKRLTGGIVYRRCSDGGGKLCETVGQGLGGFGGWPKRCHDQDAAARLYPKDGPIANDGLGWANAWAEQS